MKNKSGRFKKIILLGILVLFAAGIYIWYVFSEKFKNTTDTIADYTIDANELMQEFETNDSAANKKFSEKILIVNGIIAQLEQADSSINVKMADNQSGSYIIFAFQKDHFLTLKNLTPGEKISVKGSCSGGMYSEILEVESITFKRCVINK